MAGLIRDLKKFEEFSWLKAFDSAASQQVARDLEVALKNAFTKGRAQQFPTFKISFKLKVSLRHPSSTSLFLSDLMSATKLLGCKHAKPRSIINCRYRL
jgi:transposase